MTTEVGVEHDAGLGVAHVGPALEGRMVLVRDSPHDGADVERLLPARVPALGEDITDRRQATVAGVRIAADVTLDRIGGRGPAGEALARHDVAVVVVARRGRDTRRRGRRPSTGPVRSGP